jgi:hypothetical protein
MANRTFGGLRWRKNLHAPLSTTPPIEILPLSSGYATSLYLGDIVKMQDSGYLAAAAAGDTAYGVFAGVEQMYDGTKMVKNGSYNITATYSTNFERQTLVRIIPIFGQVFEVCTYDVASGYDTYAEHLAMVNENCEWVAGTASGDDSGTKLNLTTHASTNTLSLRLVGLSKQIDDDFAAAGIHWYVTGNLVQRPTAGSSTGNG